MYKKLYVYTFLGKKELSIGVKYKFSGIELSDKKPVLVGNLMKPFFDWPVLGKVLFWINDLKQTWHSYSVSTMRVCIYDNSNHNFEETIFDRRHNHKFFLLCEFAYISSDTY